MIKIRSTSGGFTFIEVMLAVVIITITSMGLMYGVVHARSELRSLEIKERASEELYNYMEHWKGRIASGKLSISDISGDYLGKEIYLIGDEDEQSGTKVMAKIYYSMDEVNTSYNNNSYEAYSLKVWIKWSDFMMKPDRDNQDTHKEHERTLETVIMVYDT